jgi:hypothetical protein
MRRAARTRAGAMIILTGEPGIGKTALLRAVVEQASRSGSMVGLGHAEEIDQIAPGAPLLLALRSGPRPLVDGSAFAGLASLYDQQGTTSATPTSLPRYPPPRTPAPADNADTPRTCTALAWISITNKTYTRRSSTLST